MRTLALLAALLVFALQAQTEPLGDTDDQLPAQDQPGSEVQQMTISFEGGERSAREASGERLASMPLGSTGPLKGLVSTWRLGSHWVYRGGGVRVGNVESER